MSKKDVKKAKAKGGKESKQKKQEEKEVLAELELSEEELAKVGGGALNAYLPAGRQAQQQSADISGPGPNNLLDALNLGMY
jgi:hypothetical protein